jgi:hypothetical protein
VPAEYISADVLGMDADPRDTTLLVHSRHLLHATLVRVPLFIALAASHFAKAFVRARAKERPFSDAGIKSAVVLREGIRPAKFVRRTMPVATRAAGGLRGRSGSGIDAAQGVAPHMRRNAHCSRCNQAANTKL